MDRLKVSDLKVGMHVKDTTGNCGVVKNIKDEHNVIVKFENRPGGIGCTGGYGFYCLNPECKDQYDPIYKA